MQTRSLVHCRGTPVTAVRLAIIGLAVTAGACAQSDIGGPDQSASGGQAMRSGSGGVPAGSGGNGAIATGGNGEGTGGGSGGAEFIGSGGAPAIIDAGAGGQSGGDVPLPATGSAGCGKMPATALGAWSNFDQPIIAGGQMRTYGIRLPTSYDPQKPYRLIFSHHACQSHGTNLVNIDQATGFDAIIIAPNQSLVPRDCFDDQARQSSDLPLFDALVTWAEDNLCIDKSRIFALGFSSGSWMANILGCERADVIRAKANVSGGLTKQIMPDVDCKGPVAGIFLHDSDDHTNGIAEGIYARGVLLKENGCGTTTKPYAPAGIKLAPATCTAYDDCKAGYPVVWCQTAGRDHMPQNDISPNIFWNFVSQF
ncbi:MAG TPA: hypothetical protein VGL59_21075 [Polyangia bacterium]|jgi:poly(3-hydroxybutyrate) depolymerase